VYSVERHFPFLAAAAQTSSAPEWDYLFTSVGIKSQFLSNLPLFFLADIGAQAIYPEPPLFLLKLNERRSEREIPFFYEGAPENDSRSRRNWLGLKQLCFRALIYHLEPRVKKVGVFALTEQIVQTPLQAPSATPNLLTWLNSMPLVASLCASSPFFSILKPHCRRPRKKTEGGIVCSLQSGFVALKSATRARSAPMQKAASFALAKRAAAAGIIRDAAHCDCLLCWLGKWSKLTYFKCARRRSNPAAALSLFARGFARVDNQLACHNRCAGCILGLVRLSLPGFVVYSVRLRLRHMLMFCSFCSQIDPKVAFPRRAHPKVSCLACR
jgi:hypothetical protein